MIICESSKHILKKEGNEYIVYRRKGKNNRTQSFKGSEERAIELFKAYYGDKGDKK